uniref:Uncharacterized protein n=1 Tax=Opuntia streptacantha TaxID=393608 RepID=A0A7C9EB95_OPUST
MSNMRDCSTNKPSCQESICFLSQIKAIPDDICIRIGANRNSSMPTHFPWIKIVPPSDPTTRRLHIKGGIESKTRSILQKPSERIVVVTIENGDILVLLAQLLNTPP